MHFALGLPDGTEAVSSFGSEPLIFRMGDGTLSEGLELALYGLRAGAEQTLRIDGSMVYGPRDESNVHAVPLQRFPHAIRPEPGLVVAFTTAEGEEVAGTVLDVSADAARVDFNHPLAGREIVFRVQILSVTPAADAAGE
jgi:FKBP-type peptidyl-prolyl cis-trans isomerase SlpA